MPNRPSLPADGSYRRTLSCRKEKLVYKASIFALGTAVSLILAASVSAAPLPLTGDMAHSTSGLGDFSATLNYSYTDATHATLSINLTNTTNPAIGGYLTAFVFNNPGSHITGVPSLTTDFASFSVLGGPTFQKAVNGAPYGQFDLGASTFSSFEGGGNPSVGIGVGQTGHFQFAFTGTGLNTLTTASFLNELSIPPGQGMGAEYFVARFRGMANEGSDKVPGMPANSAPEPTTLFLAALGAVLGGSYLRRRRCGERGV
jgi:hypothetical protein